jgi:hypothetical protein
LLPVVLLIPVSDDGEDDLLLVYSFICGDIPDGNDDDTLVRWLTEAIFAPVAASVNREVALVLFVVAIFCCCFEVDIPAATVVAGFAVVACCGGDDDTADAGGVADDNKGGFTVLGIPHTRASVVLTTLRPGLLGYTFLLLVEVILIC